MPIEAAFGNFFKSEIKASGRRLVAEEKLAIANGSDTTVQAYVRASPPVKVTLSAAGVASPAFVADCTCPMGKKNQFCKHVWAALVAAEAEFPDFLSAKRSIEKAPPPEIGADSETSYPETAKLRASEYRKDQYRKQKERVKDAKRAQRAREPSVNRVAYSAAVESALAYFAQNGFPMPDGPSETLLAEAKRKLSRVFHPDKGGSHSEIVELNENCEVLVRFLGV